MINYLKLLFRKSIKQEEPKNEELKIPIKEFDRFGRKSASIYIKKDTLYFQVGAQSDNLSLTSGDNMTFKLPKSATSTEKGEAIIKVLDAFTINKNYEDDLKIIKDIGTTKSEALLTELSNSRDIKLFFRKTKLCGVNIKKSSDIITFVPYVKEKGRGYRNYSGNNMAKKLEASKDDLVAIGNTLDEAIEFCFA